VDHLDLLQSYVPLGMVCDRLNLFFIRSRKGHLYEKKIPSTGKLLMG
jgi:hypothetical protein